MQLLLVCSSLRKLPMAPWVLFLGGGAFLCAADALVGVGLGWGLGVGGAGEWL